MVKKNVHTVKQFAETIKKILMSDRGVNIACSGETGEGKSTFLIQLQKIYSEIAGQDWTFDHLTWERDELMRWIDGEGENKEGRVPEYTAILADEMINMFFNQEWHDPEQQDLIKTLNQCRDRHLFFGGNNPSFFDLNPKVRDRFNFFVFIPERGIAWVFVPEKNPFTKDKWNTLDNIKIFRRYKTPYYSHNFAFEVHFSDLDDDEKERYLAIRNKKRVESLDKTKEKREFDRANKKDFMLGKAVVKLMEVTGKTQAYVGQNILGITAPTMRKYVNFGKSQLALEQNTKDSKD